MENSISYLSYTAKTFDNSLNNNPINIKTNKAIKTNSKLIPKLIIPKNNSASNIFFDKTAYTSLGKNSCTIKNIYNKLTPSCLRNNKKYGNYYIFGKRELIFRKIMSQGRKVFKYHQSIGIENKKSTLKPSRKKSNSLFLTQPFAKTTKHKRRSALPLIEKDKTIFDLDKSNINNKNQNLSRNSLMNLSNINIDDFLTNKNYNDNIDPNKKGIILLKKISLNKGKENKPFDKYKILKRITLIKKQEVLKKNLKGIISLKTYIKGFHDMAIDKFNLNIKKEKVKVLNETMSNKLNKINDQIKDLQANSKLFIDEFYPKLNEYIKFCNKQRDKERQKDLFYLNKIYLLEKKINSLKTKIGKYQNEKEFLMREMFLQISIYEKKLELPNYYKDILLNDFTLEQTREKYGKQIDQEEYNRVLKYMDSLDVSDMESVFDKLNILTNNNIELLNSYNKAHANNLVYKKHREKAENEFKKSSQKENEDLIKLKKRQLDAIIKAYKNTEKDYLNIIKNNPRKTSKNQKHSKLFIKVSSILKNLNKELKYELDIDDKIRGEITEEKIIIQMIRRIEMIIIKFLAIYKEEKINYANEIREFKIVYDRQRKIQKNIEQRKNILRKFELERKRIFDRHNKILFIPNKKVDFKKQNKKNSNCDDSSKLEEKSNKIDEFLYD